jgi:hypothetical protein
MYTFVLSISIHINHAQVNLFPKFIYILSVNQRNHDVVLGIVGINDELCALKFCW